MVRIASFVVVGLLAVTGCAASQKPVVTTSSAAPACDYGPIPGETQMSFGDEKGAPASEAASSKGDLSASFRPNAQERPKSGAVHPAVY